MSSFLQNTRVLGGGRKAGLAAAMVGVTFLSGCAETGEFDLKSMFSKPQDVEAEVVSRASTDTELIERDVEAPEVFEATEAGLWDGRPSLGGVWVAHPDVTEPERVLIRNTSNDKFVVGALFRRERDVPGPRLQVSSDAADALTMLAGAPTQLEVVALRKEAVPIEEPLPAPVETDVIEEAAPIQTASLDPLAGVEAAIEAAPLEEATAAPVAATEAAVPAPEAAAAPKGSLKKSFLQIGIYSSEENATRASDVLRGAGMIPTIDKSTSNGKTSYRVVVGPAQTVAERNELLAQIKKQGYTDAYPVTN